ncbi:hypothetical protein [Nostoc sp. CHAB 5715]|uniref:hypothetical protein n=1 Tax=Nostoc sp. CHAB 5715 TaxID=2780400 RepID=UPI001E339439|nr:hypothetical protein [Nostoc sp. CHAB 5715]MCC5625699.1 hypothetical protein [Nostoc sp. CHAB 5715]
MTVYLYYGEDSYSLNQRIDYLVNQNVHAEWRAFNYVKLSGNEKNIAAKVFTEVMTLPFGESNKIIHTDSDSLIGSLSNEDNNQELENHLSRIPSSNILLITGNKKPDSRRTVVKTILKYAQQEEFPSLVYVYLKIFLIIFQRVGLFYLYTKKRMRVLLTQALPRKSLYQLTRLMQHLKSATPPY